MTRRLLLLVTLLFGLALAGAAAWVLARIGALDAPGAAPARVRKAPATRPPASGDDISDESREALRKILREAESED